MASPPPSTMPVVTAFLKPVRSTVTEYRPRTSGGDVYAPESFVTRTVFTLVSSLWIVTVAPGTAEPCASVTTPLIVARSERWARAGALTAHTKRTAVIAARSKPWWDLAISTSRRGVKCDPTRIGLAHAFDVTGERPEGRPRGFPSRRGDAP